MRIGLRAIAALGGLMLGLALPATANAWYGHTEASASMRAGPGVKYKRIATIPAGARIWVDWCKSNWCYATWKSRKGYVAASLIGVRARGPAYDSYYDYEMYGAYDDYWWLYYHDRPWWNHHKPPHCKDGNCPKPPKPPKWDGPKGPKWDGPKGPKWNGSKMDGPKMKMGGDDFRPNVQMHNAPSDMSGPMRQRDDDRDGRGFDRERWKD